MTLNEEDGGSVEAWNTMTPQALAALDPEGDFVKQHLLNPVVLRLLGDVRGLRVLDAGAGQGYFSRMLAARGASVVALEPAESLYGYGLEQEQQRRQGIEWVRADLTVIELAPEFDRVVANMVFLSIPEWTAALGTCVRALHPGGRLVLSLEHPCADDGDYFTERSMPRRYAADLHRPLSHYLNGVIRAGCELDEVVEPTLEPALVAQGPPGCEALVYRPGYLVVSAVRRRATT